MGLTGRLGPREFFGAFPLHITACGWSAVSSGCFRMQVSRREEDSGMDSDDTLGKVNELQI